MDKLQEAMSRLASFEAGSFQQPVDAEKLIVEIFQACGHVVSQKGFAASGEGVDCFVRTDLNGVHQTIGVEVKAGKQPVSTETIEKALNLKAIRSI